MKRCFLLFVLNSNSLIAQQNLSLTKQEMYADFDTLANTIIKLSPHVPIKKELWGYDASAEILKKRKQMDTISSDLSFYILLQKVLNANLDMHTSNIGNQEGLAAIEMSNYNQIRNSFKFSLGNIYINGKYYITHPFVVNKDTIPIGSEITHFENESVDAYVKKHLDSRSGFKYDLKHKKFYFTGFFKNAETIFKDSLLFTFKLINGKSKNYKINTKSFTSVLKSSSINGADSSRVEFWTNEKILYIRLKEMEEDKIPFMTNEIHKYRSKLNDIKKIIVDFRGNPGGSDTAWVSLFSELIPFNIERTYKIDDLNNPEITDVSYAERGYKNTKRIKETNALLKKFNYYTINNNKDVLEPSVNSLMFKGKIYVLAEDHYSSTGSAISFVNSNGNDNLISVGRRTDYFLGAGYSPIKFQLPNCKLVYRVAPSIEVTNVKKLADVLQDKMDLVVPNNINYYAIRFNFNGNINSAAFLLKYDPFIKAVLAQ